LGASRKRKGSARMVRRGAGCAFWRIAAGGDDVRREQRHDMGAFGAKRAMTDGRDWVSHARRGLGNGRGVDS
jgi:hypothetical protein